MEERKSAAIIVEDKLGDSVKFQANPELDTNPAKATEEFEKTMQEAYEEFHRETRRVQTSFPGFNPWRPINSPA